MLKDNLFHLKELFSVLANPIILHDIFSVLLKYIRFLYVRTEKDDFSPVEVV